VPVFGELAGWRHHRHHRPRGCSVIEKWVRKRVPAWLDLFVVPVVTVLVGAAVCILVIMPIAGLLMQGINWVLIDLALERGGVIGGYLLSSLFLPLVMLGIHQGSPHPRAADRRPRLHPAASVLAMAGAGEVGMAIAIYVKTKSARLKSIIRAARPSAFSAWASRSSTASRCRCSIPHHRVSRRRLGGAFVAYGIQATGGFGRRRWDCRAC
jgi:PTS system sucrose-specific IIC component